MSAIQMHYLKQMKRLKYKITLARILQSVPHYKNPVCNDF